MPDCVEDGCTRTAVAFGLCHAHYVRKRRAGVVFEREVVGESPRLSVRVAPAVREWLLTRPGGARALIERWARAQMAEMLTRAAEAIDAERATRKRRSARLEAQAQAVASMLSTLEAGDLPRIEEMLAIENAFVRDRQQLELPLDTDG